MVQIRGWNKTGKWKNCGNKWQSLEGKMPSFCILDRLPECQSDKKYFDKSTSLEHGNTKQQRRHSGHF